MFKVLKLMRAGTQTLLFLPEAEFFLLARRFRQYPLPEGGYFTQFCLTVATKPDKTPIFADQYIIKWANLKPDDLPNFGLRHDVVRQRHALSVNGSL